MKKDYLKMNFKKLAIVFFSKIGFTDVILNYEAITLFSFFSKCKLRNYNIS